jgi:hypothetical protein
MIMNTWPHRFWLLTGSFVVLNRSQMMTDMEPAAEGKKLTDFNGQLLVQERKVHCSISILLESSLLQVPRVAE